MFRTYFKTAGRFLLKNKTFSFINVFGLALGTLCCTYILIYVKDQYSYDKHHRDVERIYRLDKVVHTPEGIYHLAISGGSNGPALKRDFAEVEQFTRVVPYIGVDKHLLKYKNKSFYEKDPFYVDSTFFDVFTYHFVEGNSRALMRPFTVLSYPKIHPTNCFGSEDPVGKIITLDNTHGKTGSDGHRHR